MAMRKIPKTATVVWGSQVKYNISPVRHCLLWYIVLICSGCFFPCLSSVLGQNRMGQIQGTVIDKKNSQPLVEQNVYLTIHRGEETQKRETVTSGEGRYVFDDLLIGVDTHYSVTTTHEGKEYIETDLVLSEWVPLLKINIEISQSTDDASQIVIRQHTIIITPPPIDHASDGAVSVMEMVQIENVNNLDFQTVVNGQTVGLHVNLPKGHEGLQFDPMFTKHPMVKSNQLVSNQPLASGSVNTGFSYIMHVENSVLDLSRVLTFATNKIYVFVADGMSFIPQSPIFGGGRREQIHEMTYTIYATNFEKSLSSGQTPELSFKFSGRRANSSSQNNIANSSLQASSPWTILLIAVAAAAAGGFLVAAIFLVRSGADQSTQSRVGQDVVDASWVNRLDMEELAHARIGRLEMITHLDKMCEKKEISEKVYNHLRKEQVDRLENILEKSR